MFMIANASDWSRGLPKIIVPRQSRLTCSPLRPTRTLSIGAVQSNAAKALAEEPVLLLSELVQEPRPLGLDVVPAECLVPRHGSLQPSGVGEPERQQPMLVCHLIPLG